MGSKEVSKKTKGKSSSSKSTKKPAAPSQNPRSNEFVADSDKDSESEKANSDDDSLPEKPIAKTIKANGSKPKEKSKKTVPVAAPVAEEEDTSSSGEEESSPEDGDTTEEESEEGSEKQIPNPPQQQTPQPTNSNPTEEEPDKPLATFQLPKGFKPLPPTSSSGTPKIASLLSKTNLSKKQIFHFTTPASVPINALKQLKYGDIQAGKLGFSHDGTVYEIAKEQVGADEEMKVMIVKDGEYSIGKHIKVTKSLHFRQAVPSALTAKSKSSRATVPKKRPARAQPKGLRVRFRSGGMGVDSGSDEDEDEDED